MNFIKKIINLLYNKVKEDFQADYWDNKWKKSILVYNAKGIGNMDVRNLVYTKSYIIRPEVRKIIRGCKTDDEKAIKIFEWVRNNIKYISDKKNLLSKNLAVENWQDAETTFLIRQGDCEDGALLTCTMLIIAGIPEYKSKICAGWVQPTKTAAKGGHAYCIYLLKETKNTADGVWYALDWCYYPSKSLNRPHSKQEYYKDIWWTFNNKNTWAQHDTIVK